MSDAPTMTILRRNIRIILAHRDQTMTAACEAAEEDQSAISKVLARGNPTLSSLEKVAKILEVEVWELLKPM